MGDFNAHIVAPDPLQDELFIDSNLIAKSVFSSEDLNQRGISLINVMDSANFIVINGRSISDCPAQPTYYGRGNSIIDLAWVNVNGLDHIEDFGVLLSVSFSDHFPIFLSLSQNLLTNQTVKIHSLNKKSTGTKLMWNSNNKFDYSFTMKWSPLLCVSFDSESINCIQERLLRAVTDASTKLGMSQTIRTKKNSSSHVAPWHDKECKEKKHIVNRELKLYRQNNFNPEDRVNYQIELREYKNTCKNKKE